MPPRPTDSSMPSVTVLVPTYREAPNMPHLLARLARVRQHHALELDVLIVDDDSADGLERVVAACGYSWVQVVVRTHERGLSEAVVDGLALCRGDAVVVMDADLSHPPEKIPELLAGLVRGRQLMVGSRYAPGGATDENWGALRWLNSRVAILLARPLTGLKDPMAGFFAVRRQDVVGRAPLLPIGYKILLELIVRCDLSDIEEVPIVFSDRKYGESKLTVKQRLLYLEHLRRLYAFRWQKWRHQDSAT